MSKKPQNENPKKTSELKTSKPVVVKKPQQIFDTDNSRNVGITLWTEKTLQAITKNSGQHAVANEYQVHYWAINVRITAQDGSRLDISIPTVLFNYKQEVSPAHIDFELTDVDDVSNALQVIHNIEVNKLLPILQEEWADAALAATVEYISTNLNSLHRHPGGRRQSFSGTDYQKNPDSDTGIVFPLSEGENKSNFASIIAHEDGQTYLAHTEYRVANGKVDGDKGKITYTRSRCASYVSAPMHQVSAIEAMFGYENKVKKYVVTDHLKVEGVSVFDTLMEWWDNVGYHANTDFIKPENVTKKVYKQPVNKFHSYGKAPAKPVNGNLKQQVMSYEVEEEETHISPAILAEVIAFAMEQYELEIPAFDTLEHLTQEELNGTFFTLELHYYSIDEDAIKDITDTEMLGYFGVTTNDIALDELIELYDLVLAELVEEMLEEDSETVEVSEVDRMRKELIGLGAHPDHVRNAPDAQIEIWYEGIMG